MIKACFFDIDGTLVPMLQGYVPESTRKALYDLHDRGIKLFIASGRPKSHIAMMPQELIDFPWDGYVLFNGQCCCDENFEIFHEECFTKESMASLVPYIKENNIPVIFFEKEYSYKNRDIPNQLGGSSGVTDDPERALTHDTYQLAAYIPEEEDDEFVSHGSGIKSARWLPLYADIIPEDGGKPEGCARQLKRFGITREESMAFGDGGNDITMLEFAGCGVAMGNADDRVKSHADYVTDDCDKDGIINALRHFNVL